MRLVLIIVSVIVFSLLAVWGLNQYLSRKDYAMNTTQQLLQEQTSEPVSNSVDYSKDKVEEINQKTLQHSSELNQLP